MDEVNVGKQIRSVVTGKPYTVVMVQGSYAAVKDETTKAIIFVSIYKVLRTYKEA